MATKQVSWQLTATRCQQEMCDIIGNVDWDKYTVYERHFIARKVKVILYGPSEDDRYISKEAQSLVREISAVIVKEGTHRLVGDLERATYMTFVYVIGCGDGENISQWPVFKVPKDETGENIAFIDVNCRVYKNWEDFLVNNKFAACEYCYPENGKYFMHLDNVVLKFGQSPEAKVSTKLLNTLDTASIGFGLGSAALSIASFFVPVAGPLMSASIVACQGSLAYSTVRSTNALHDRRIHKQSIGLRDKEARNCYINILGNAFGLGAGAASSAAVRTAQSGRVMGKLASNAVTSLNVGNLVMNGIGVINGFCNLVEKHKDENLTSLDVIQFSASLLVFCHASTNFKTARCIIENAQTSVLNDFEKGLGKDWQRSLFRKVVQGSTKICGKPSGNALVIRSLKYINNASHMQINEPSSIRKPCDGLLGKLYKACGIGYLASLLTVHEMVELKHILCNFTETFQKVILELSDALFKLLNQTLGLEFVHIARFIGELVEHLVLLALNCHTGYLLSILDSAISHSSFEGMSSVDLCLSVLRNLLQNPNRLLEIYKHIKSFFSVLLEKTSMPILNVKIEFFKLVSVSNILLKINLQDWESIIDSAKELFDSMELRKFSSLVTIIKNICLWFQKEVLDIRYRRNKRNRSNNDSEYEKDITSAMKSMKCNGVKNIVENDLE